MQYFISMSKYNHCAIEKKWQRIWKESKEFCVKEDLTKPKFYILDMFPYPSGAGLHVGHVTGYTATDIIARHKRTKGYNVLHPMGWDSFGLPAEQYAILTGTHPSITTKKNIEVYRRQLQSLGFSYDWSREIATSDPSYYKWTQWIFTKLYEKGLAYEADVLVNFCPTLGTVLANEEVENGVSKEGGHGVERRALRQWVLKITAYADRLIEDLATVDWPDSIKRLQVSWIGKSEGAKICFREESLNEKILVFTTRPGTIFGATYLVLSPEHPLISLITTKEQEKAVLQYQKHALTKTDLQRTDLSYEKDGVWTGAFAINPVNNERVPIWISDYVLMTYGTGAVMAVPAHDERDFAFAQKFQLPIKHVIASESLLECWTGDGKLIQSEFLNGLTVQLAQEEIIQWLVSRGVGEKTVNYKLRDWLFSRQRYWGEPFPILHFADGSKRCLDIDELPLCPPELKDFKPTGSVEGPLAKAKEWVEIDDPKTGQKARREINTMPQWAGSCWYYLRFCDPHNQIEAWDLSKENYWMPVDLYVGGVEHAVLHLLYARFWHKVLYDCGLVSTLEPFQKLRNQGLVASRSFQLPSGLYISSDEVEEKNGEYFQLGTTIKLRTQVEKMSKSKHNGITPDEMIEEFGADTLRLYEMFMGPFDQEKLWNTDAVLGCSRFLSRFYALIVSDKICEESTEESLKLVHKLLYHVEKDIEAMSFNTAIAKLMEFINDFAPLERYPREALKMATQALYPFAPHIAEEAFEILGEKKHLTDTPFPQINPLFLVETKVTYVVQINGKVRGKWELEKDQTEEQLLAFAQAQSQIAKYLQGKVEKVVFVPNRLINIVIHPS
jgi:leucyl-tRNA synthetase